MAQRLTRSFISTSVPGAYPNVSVKSTPVGISSTGIVSIIGEADGGANFAAEDIKSNFFTPDQLDRVVQKYVGGPIVEAMRALSAPSADAGITGSATRIYIVKTNAGTKASATLDTNYGTLSANNQGTAGNSIKYQVTASQMESAPSVTSSVIAAFGATLNGATFTVRINGGASATVTLSNTPADHADRATLLVELAALLPAGINVAAGVAADTITLSLPADSVNYRKGWGKSFELAGSGLSALGLPAGLRTSSAESEIELSVIRADAGINETLTAAGEIALQVGYEGTTATLSISGNTMTTAVTGGSGANLSIDMSQFQTVKDLSDFITSNTGYTAMATTIATQMRPSDLDKVTAIGICSTASAIRPGRIKRSLANFKNAVSQSSAVEFSATDVDGLPSPMATAAFLSGGTKGSTTGADFVDALAKLEAVQTNFVVPLFSRDASEDIAEALTESSSTYTIDAIHASVKSHVLKMSTPKLKRNRLAILSAWGTFASSEAKAQTLASFRCSMTFQKVSQANDNGEVQNFLPWYGAAIAAGMQAAGFYKGITNKFANVISFEDPSGFDSGNPGDVERSIESGMLIIQRETAGSKWVSDQTTYGFDTNFVYNSVQAAYLADVAALDLADSLQRAFVGQSLADVDAATASSFIANKMDEYKRLKIISASDDAPLGYKNLKIDINGPVLEVSLEIKLSTTVYFIPINLSISAVQQSA